MNSKTKIIFTFVVLAILGSFISINQNDSLKDDPLPKKYGTLNTDLGSPQNGSPSAPITILVFGDYTCTECKDWFFSILPEIEKNYVQQGTANIVFIDMLSHGNNSFLPSKAAYCASDQEKFWEYQKKLFQNQQKISISDDLETHMKFSDELGLNQQIFKNCIESNKFEQKIKFAAYEAKKNGISKIPTFILIDSKGNSEKIVGLQPYSVFIDAINSMD
jgi:protein-disulfide isomerase